MQISELLKAIRCTQIVGLDYETFWADDYTLKKQATTDYIYDDRFEMQLGAVMTHRQTKAKALERKPFQAWVKTVDWANTALLAHHTQFDALIAYRHFGVKPKFYLDTLSMARAVMPVTVGGSLHKVAQAFGLPGKRYGDALVATKNRRWADFTKDEKANLKIYAGDDIEQTFEIFKRLLPFVPLDELRLIDATIKMYANPRLLLDEPMLLDLARREVERKQVLMDKLGVTPTVLQSNDKFAQLLEAYGVQPPTKVSAKTGKVTWAFAKNDLEFKELLEHDDENVRALMEARFGVKSTMVETRAFKMASRAKYGPQPIYLNYCGAGTTRWSGGDQCLVGSTQIKVKREGHVMLLRLDNLRPDDLVWDGEEYVAHDGLVCRGEQDVIEHDGIVGTADHKVYLKHDAAPIPLKDAARLALPLEGDYGAAYWKSLRRLCTSAKSRCTNPKDGAYANYGGRGITFDFESPTQMAEYVQKKLGPRPSPKHSIDRVDNARGYAPGNLRWATLQQQARNKREYQGWKYGTRTRALLRKRPDFVYETIRSLVAQGLSDEEILARPKGVGGRPRTATTSPRVGDVRHG